MKKLFLLIITCILLLPLFSGCATVEDQQFSLTESDEPVPYSEDEFPPWLQDVRRAEVIFAGSLPFTILVSNAGYGIYNFAVSGAGSGYDITAITSSAAMSNDEKTQILLIGAGLSAGLALADFIIGLFTIEDEFE